MPLFPVSRYFSRFVPGAYARMSHRLYCVYIMTNDRHTVLYTGVTSDLKRRVWEHREGLVDGFTSRQNISKLVYYDATADVRAAIVREKQIKAGSRRKKVELILRMNPKWRDLYEGL